jgi:hypothetical protein
MVENRAVRGLVDMYAALEVGENQPAIKVTSM